MGLLERIQENEGTEAAKKFCHRSRVPSRKIVLKRQGVEYQIDLPTTMSDVDLVLRDTFETAHKRKPTEVEMGELENLLAKAVTE